MPDMKRFLVEFEIESHSCLVDGLDEQKLTSADDGVDYLLSNLATEIGNEHPMLCLQVFLDAPDFGTAEELGKEKAMRFAQCVSFSTSFACQIHRMTRIADWTIGLPKRKAQVFNSYRGHDLPYKVLTTELLRTVEAINSLKIREEIAQALKWHHYGVLSEYTDEKFQYFWLSLETLVQIIEDATKVSDLCAKCHSPLYCEKCESYPTHRPYAKQKIESLFNELNRSTGQKIFDDANRVRNVISHGSDVSSFVQSAEIDFNDLVNTLGRMSFLGLLSALQKYSDLQQGEGKYQFLQVNTFIKTTLNTFVDISFSSKDPDAPVISDFPNINFEATFHEREQG